MGLLATLICVYLAIGVIFVRIGYKHDVFAHESTAEKLKLTLTCLFKWPAIWWEMHNGV